MNFLFEPYFVQTPWFVALIVCMVVGSLASLIRLRQLALKRRTQILAGLVADRTSELEMLADLAEHINSAVLPEDVLQHVFDSFRPNIPYDRIGFGAITEDGLSLRAIWARSDADDMEIKVGYEAKLSGSSLEEVLETGEPRILNDLEAYLAEHPDSESTRRIVSEGMRSSLTCPLSAMGKPLGFLFFSSCQAFAFNDSHVRFFLQIAGQVSLAIEKSRLYSDLLHTRELLENANRALEELASRDGLTGLANRRTLDTRLDDEWRRSIRSGRALSLLMVDIDFFKLYNDTYGHIAGDECLKNVASELARSFQRSGECAARYGGEEFAVILPETDAVEAGRAADRLLESFQSLQIEHESSPIGPWVTLSIGVASAKPIFGAPIETLVGDADRALYQAKRDGRNRWCRASGDGESDFDVQR